MNDSQPQVVCPKYYDKRFLFVLGLGLMIANKARHSLKGYFSPRPFSPLNIDDSVTYCINVVQNWSTILTAHTNESDPFLNKKVLEIGPGPDLGTGLIVVSLGANMYTAVDKHYLVSQTSQEFYERLLAKLRGFPFYERAETACQSLLTGEPVEWFRYMHAPLFPHGFERLNAKYDVLVSQAVLEHFSETEVLLFFREIQKNLCSKAKMVHEIDLATHTRFLRDIDPLNILRYSDFIWNALRFDGTPNRLRMSHYGSILRRLRYMHVNCHPLRLLDLDYVKAMKVSLHKRYRKHSTKDLSILIFHLLAERD